MAERAVIGVDRASSEMTGVMITVHGNTMIKRAWIETRWLMRQGPTGEYRHEYVANPVAFRIPLPRMAS